MRYAALAVLIIGMSIDVCAAQDADARRVGDHLAGNTGVAQNAVAPAMPHFRFKDSRDETHPWLRTATMLAAHSLGWCNGKCVRETASPSPQQVRLQPAKMDARFIGDEYASQP